LYQKGHYFSRGFHKVAGSGPKGSKKGAMEKGGCFLPLKTRKAHEIKGFEHLTKHRLRRYEALAKLV
jgi:hypothetical protein